MMMNKYIQAFLDDNNLKVGEKFELYTGSNHYYFSNDGNLKYDLSTGENHTSSKLVDVLNNEYRIKKISPIPSEKFIPKKGERYYFVTAGGSISYTVNYDVYLVSHNLVFEIREQAEDYKWFLDKVDEYKKPFKYEDYNNFLYYDHYYESIEMLTVTTAEYQGTIHFGDKANTKAFIEEVGEERIKKYMFDVWD